MLDYSVLLLAINWSGATYWKEKRPDIVNTRGMVFYYENPNKNAFNVYHTSTPHSTITVYFALLMASISAESVFAQKSHKFYNDYHILDTCVIATNPSDNKIFLIFHFRKLHYQR